MVEGGPKMKKTHEIRVFREVLPYIINGQKTYEVRVAWNRFRTISVGDILDFGNGVSKTVTEIQRFASPEECLGSLDPEKILPGHTSEELLTIWNERSDPGGKGKDLGILAFKME